MMVTSSSQDSSQSPICNLPLQLGPGSYPKKHLIEEDDLGKTIEQNERVF